MLLLLAACGSPSQPDDTKFRQAKQDTITITQPLAQAAKKETESDPIVTIRQVVERINGHKLDVKHTEFMCDEQMKVERFYQNKELVKITVDFGTVGDVYAREDYYYRDGNLIFKYEFVEGGPACEGCVKKNVYRSYIKNDQVIKYLKDQVVEKCRTCSFEKRSRYYQLLKAKTDEDIKSILCR